MYAPDHPRRKEVKDAMYRSNSSLDLIYAEHPSGNGLRREYGSHGSIDVIGGGNERYIPTMVHNYSVVSSGDKPSSVTRLTDRFSEILTTDHADGPTPRASVSPKPRLKLNKLWGGNTPIATRQCNDDTSVSGIADATKRKQFAHYDCQSLMANLSYAAEIRGALLSRRRNTTTGASAASLLATRGLPPGEDTVPDTGDGRFNEMIDSCPFFRNELGGEEERCVSLCHRTARGGIPGQFGGWHRPKAAYGFSVLEFPPGHTHWRQGCPFAKSVSPLPVESQDLGALYFRNYFYTQPHQNWFGMDENLGPIAISIKKERVELRRGGGDASTPASQLAWQYRLIIRTSELLTLRGSILEDALPTVKPSNNSATYNTKEVLEYIAPELQLNSLRLGLTNTATEEQLLRLDEQRVTRHYKVGVMYCKSGQSTEEEMYNNQEAGPAFVEFLQMLGQTVRLKDFDKYKAGLDNRTDSTGLYSVYTTYQGCEIMFHVSTMLPYTSNNRQQLLRKRHIGNDIVTIVFQEPGAAPFTPRHIRSQFQHVFVVVRVIDPCTENTHYSIAVSRAKEVPLFGPPIKDGAVYPKGDAFTDLLLSKIINGENAAIQSPKFSTMATRTRQEYLKDLAKNYVTATTLETGQKFSIFSSLLMKSNNSSSNSTVIPKTDDCTNDVLVGGALCFHVQVQDEGAGGTSVDCILGISADSIVFVEDLSRQIILAVPTNTLLGWVISGEWTRIYYHRGESVRVRNSTDVLLRRLSSVAPQHAHSLKEITLERGAASQLGFHVQPDGLVTAVEGGGPAARAGVRRGARLLEVCRAAVVALPHDHLVDLLKTSDPVTVTLTFASSGRCECQTYAGEAWAQQPGRRRLTHDRPTSPPRSDSSGYGTGGSGRSAASPGGEAVRRRSHDDASPRHPRRPRLSANTSSLTEELMRLMDAELGDAKNTALERIASSADRVGSSADRVGSSVDRVGSSADRVGSSADRVGSSADRVASSADRVGSSVDRVLSSVDRVGSSAERVGSSGTNAPTPQGAPLPLPDASALDWAALVHTATRAMLQICEEHQYPSLENSDPPLEPLPSESLRDWPERPTSERTTPAAPNTSTITSTDSTACACGLKERVATLEADAVCAQRHQHQLEEEVRRLRRHNARLREESARAVWQLRHFTQWLKRTVDK
ncbi:signal-induced proliferation-associated 1-like protein 2 [Pieris rapae]|uniref:signal-induced proliferation-associated 1-like protein 2 n=1 Tax=Pieris rapae TaxID=64459 RepID=UPI001E27CF97|nr:signal-induced proliferation-associated 1-like protein 2 [Pieris rapae]